MSREQFRIAIANLRANRTRTALTTLGIIIGVASITFVMALGAGARQAVTEQVKRLDGNVIIVKPGQGGYRNISAYNPYNTAITTTLTESDYLSVEKLENVKSVAPVMFLTGSVKGTDTKPQNAAVIATNKHLVDILGLKIKSGQFIDDETQRDTAVLGQRLSIQLFGTDMPLGQTVQIKGRQHTVIGTVKNTNTPINLSGIDLDGAAYVNLDDGKSYNQGIAQIQQLTMQVENVDKLALTANDIEQTILKNHRGEHDFAVLGGNKIASASDSFFGLIVAITAIVSAITLLVSGIGVMNIMLVGVNERTREIGIRKALGATDGHVMGQFVIEALLICVVGGVIGILLAYGLAFLVGMQLSFAPSLSPWIILCGFGMALVVGIIFGLYPAIKASRKDPIEALRQYQ